MLINDELIMTHSAWHLCYTAEGHYLYGDLDSSCGCSTGTPQPFFYYREAETVDPRSGHPVPQGDSLKSFARFWG